MAEIEGENGSDPTNAVVDALDENRAEFSRKAMLAWFEESQRWLEEAAQQRAEVDSESRHGREYNSLFAIQQQAVPPSWSEEEDAWVFSYPHQGAVFQEFGARPHEIRAKKAEVLAFEWPDAPQEVKEQFEHTEGDLVFFESINHPGIPAIGFVRKGRDRTQTRLEEAGYGAETFEDQGGDAA